MDPISALDDLLKHMHPVLNAGTFVFSTLPPHQSVHATEVVALIREPEGVSVIVDEATSQRLGLHPVMRCAWITLTVLSDLQAVGLTAAFSAALGGARISCNVVAGTHHDHIFVPLEQADAAMAVLLALQAKHAA